MLKKYSEFIFESLLIESNVIYSKKFKSILNLIQHPVAQKLLGIENKDLDVQSNFFDINPEKNDVVTFTPDRRAQEFLKPEKKFVKFIGRNGGWLRHTEGNNEIFNKLGYTPSEGQSPYEPQSDEVGEVIAQHRSETSGRTYIYVKFPNGSGVYNFDKLVKVDNPEMEKIWSTNRQEVRVGRAIRALLVSAGEEVLDKEIEEFVNLYKSSIDKFNDKFSYFQIVQGPDIAFWYNHKNYSKVRSTPLWNSCMSNVDDEYFDIYVMNREVVKLVILKDPEDENLIIGRALLWKLVDGKLYLDRIYTNSDSDVQLFRDYARQNGWWQKAFNGSLATSNAIDPSDGNIKTIHNLEVKLRPGYYDSYPYLDTLKYFNGDIGHLGITHKGHCYILEDTEGNFISCEYCDGTGRVSCYRCDGDGSWDCDNCNGSGEIENDEGVFEDCPECDGSGKEECSDCGGSGVTDCSDCR